MNYIELVELYEKISKTSKRLEKTHYVSKLLKKTPIQELEDLILLIRGKIYPEWDEKKIGVSSKLVIKAINKTTGVSDKEIEENWKKLGDLGDVARHLLSQKRQESLFKRDLIVKEVIKSFRKLSDQHNAIKQDASAKVGSYFYLVPALVAIQAWYLFGETMNFVSIIGVILIAFAVAMTVSKKTSQQG